MQSIPWTRGSKAMPYNPKRYLFQTYLKLLIDYCFVLSVLGAARVVFSILVARLLRRPFIHLPVPHTARTIRLRTNSSDIKTYHQVFILQEYDLSLDPCAAHFRSSPRTIIVDCGAHIGCSVVWFATQFPEAEIVAIEPDLANFGLLNQNVAGLDKVQTRHAALWSSKTRLAISNPDAEPWAFRTEPLTNNTLNDPTAIHTVTMDCLLKDAAGSSTCVMVKMDIEGAEHNVFSHNLTWIKFVDLMIVELHDWLFPGKDNGRTFFSAMALKPIDYVVRGENIFCFQRRHATKADETALAN